MLKQYWNYVEYECCYNLLQALTIKTNRQNKQTSKLIIIKKACVRLIEAVLHIDKTAKWGHAWWGLAVQGGEGRGVHDGSQSRSHRSAVAPSHTRSLCENARYVKTHLLTPFGSYVQLRTMDDRRVWDRMHNGFNSVAISVEIFQYCLGSDGTNTPSFLLPISITHLGTFNLLRDKRNVCDVVLYLSTYL